MKRHTRPKKHKKTCSSSLLVETLEESAARIERIEKKLDRFSALYEALLLALARTFKANIPALEAKEIIIGACYWIMTDFFESPVAIPVEVKAVSGDSVLIEPLVGDPQMWKQAAKPDELFLTRKEALAFKPERRQL